MPIARHNALPGISTLIQTTEKELQFSKVGERFFHPNIVAAATVDAGNSPTTTVRAGLLLGRITATKLLTQWSPIATDGSEWLAGILMEEQNMLDTTATAEIKGGPPVLAGGCVKASQLLILGTAFTSSPYEHVARSLMKDRFVLDDDMICQAPHWAMTRERIVTGDTTVTEAQNGTLFIVSGSMGKTTFTLPTPVSGLTYEFLQLDAQDMALASAASADDIVGMNDVGADTLTFSTMNELLGAHVRVRYSSVVAKWITEILCKHTVTMG